MIEQGADALATKEPGADAHIIRLPSVRHLIGNTSTHLVEAVIVPALTFTRC
jgi:hypothetical protein